MSLDDKLKHIIVCFIGSLLFSYGFGLGAGFAAEYKDKAWGGTFDWWDIREQIRKREDHEQNIIVVPRWIVNLRNGRGSALKADGT